MPTFSTTGALPAVTTLPFPGKLDPTPNGLANNTNVTAHHRQGRTLATPDREQNDNDDDDETDGGGRRRRRRHLRHPTPCRVVWRRCSPWPNERRTLARPPYQHPAARLHELAGLRRWPTSTENGAPAETRTPDPQIKSQLLYQLSYGGIVTAYLDTSNYRCLTLRCQGTIVI